MINLSLARLAATAGGLALSLIVGAGISAANPDLSPDLNAAVNTSCNYSQVVAAINAQSPSAGVQFNSTPQAQSFLQNFLASPPAQRRQMLEQAQTVPEAAQYVGLVQPIANTCNNY